MTNLYGDDYTNMLDRLGSDDLKIEEITKKEIIEIHDYMVYKHGGSYGIRDKGLFESTCEAPYQKVFGMDPYPTIWDKAAKYLFDFSNYQIFIDGNKRTGIGVCDAFLKKNGISLTLTPEQTYNLVMDIANHKYNDSPDLVQILKDNFVFIDKEGVDYMPPSR